jgi:hypothetical protein
MGDQRIGCHGTLGYRAIPLQTGNGRSRMPKPVVGRVKVSTGADVSTRVPVAGISPHVPEADASPHVPEAGGVDGSSAPRSDIEVFWGSRAKNMREAPRTPRNSQPRGKPAAVAAQSQSPRPRPRTHLHARPRPRCACSTRLRLRNAPSAGRACRDRPRRSRAVSAAVGTPYWLRTIRRILSRRALMSRSWPCSVGT